MLVTLDDERMITIDNQQQTVYTEVVEKLVVTQGHVGPPGAAPTEVGIVVCTVPSTTVVGRTMQVGSGMTLTNPDGVAGNPTFGLAASLVTLAGAAVGAFGLTLLATANAAAAGAALGLGTAAYVNLSSPPPIGNVTPNSGAFTSPLYIGTVPFYAAQAASATVEIRHAATAFSLDVYSFYTDPSNYQGAQLLVDSTGASFTTTRKGTGVSSPFIFQTVGTSDIRFNPNSGAAWKIDGATSHFVPTGGDNVLDIGTASARIRTLYAATSIVLNGPAATFDNGMTLAAVATGNTPSITASGIDTNITLRIASKGTGSIDFATGGTTRQFQVGYVASAVNYLQARGAATGAIPTLLAQGSDTNVPVAYFTKGLASHYFYSHSGTLQFAIGPVASAVNYLQVAGQTTGVGPTLLATGSDTNVRINFQSKGTGGFLFSLAAGSAPNFYVTGLGTEVNYVQIQGGATGAGVNISAQGSDANIQTNIFSKGAANIVLYAGGGARPLATFVDATSGVNYFQFTTSATAVNPTLGVSGSDTNIGLDFTSKGTGSIRIFSGASARLIMTYRDVASSVNYLAAQGAATANAPALYVDGSDANVTLNLSSKGTGSVGLYTGALSRLQVAVIDTASATRYLTLTGSNGGNPGISVSAGSLGLNAAVVCSSTLSATTVSDSLGDVRLLPQNLQSAAYQLVASDSGKEIHHPAADTTARTFTIPANGTVAFAIGTMVTFTNGNGAGVVTIAITTDTLRWLPSNGTGSRTLAANGTCIARKVTATEWVIYGYGLT